MQRTASGTIPKVPGRTSKTSQKLVELPEDVQTAPVPSTSPPPPEHEARSEGERMSKEQRERAGFKRITAYATAESYRSRALIAFLKREHGVTPRVFDEAIYAVYHLPLLPGYGPNVNLRSAPAPSSPSRASFSSLSHEEDYDGTYFASTSSREPFSSDGFISTSPRTPNAFDPSLSEQVQSPPDLRSTTTMSPHRAPAPRDAKRHRTLAKMNLTEAENDPNIAEAVFFDYGVTVFFGFEEHQERKVLEDLEEAGVCVKKLKEENWEIEECHFVYDPTVASPRIYNDFFTFKSHSHLLKLSLAHAIAQSTKLSLFEASTSDTLSSSLPIPRLLASTGRLVLSRKQALRMTGRLFKVRGDVMLRSNVLDTPELFWSEASLKELYDAIRDYFEISSRVQVLNDRLSVASDLLDIIHEHLNNDAMHRITWIIIWLIVVACVVELGEVLARLVVAATHRAPAIPVIAPEAATDVLLRLMGSD
ncbi:DUF155-domain-containing protein [Dacryopinax primogenitus]|uniref:DUF155-domain-containing protein n=1 Tax=Dacryopinax primogenitus (strain DJM 731) TaxID=1858805 RepID=M5GD95_DACPD|nr:DUF155-domain-containing protein [Dacryopinax primogenitus]EJU02183.1 DUF155-domain-containing protein [Dacryopinax primogenitus]